MILDPRDPYYAPVWRRVVIVVIMLGWAVYEFAAGSSGWGAIFGGAGLWVSWQFFLSQPADGDDS